MYIGREKFRRASPHTEKSDKPAQWTLCSLKFSSSNQIWWTVTNHTPTETWNVNFSAQTLIKYRPKQSIKINYFIGNKKVASLSFLEKISIWAIPFPRKILSDMSSCLHFFGFRNNNFLQSTVIRLASIPQPGGPDLCICARQWQGSPVISTGTGFLFRRLLLIAGLRWRYSNPPPHGIIK
jgi:hypothetical protein